MSVGENNALFFYPDQVKVLLIQAMKMMIVFSTIEWEPIFQDFGVEKNKNFYLHVKEPS